MDKLSNKMNGGMDDSTHSEKEEKKPHKKKITYGNGQEWMEAANRDNLHCPHPDCFLLKAGYETIKEVQEHMEEVHQKKRKLITDPKKMFKEIRKLKTELENVNGGLHHTGELDWSEIDDIIQFYLLYTAADESPKTTERKRRERARYLKIIYDLQDDFEWICHSHYMLYHSSPSTDIPFPPEINDLDHNYSMYWSFSSDHAGAQEKWLDLLVDPRDFTYDCWEAGQDDQDREWAGMEYCIERLRECLDESHDQLKILEEHVKKYVDIIRIQALRRGNKSRLKSKAEGIITKKQLEEDWTQLKRQMQSSGFKPDEIKQFYNDHYMESLARKKKKKSKKKKSKKPKKPKKKTVRK